MNHLQNKGNVILFIILAMTAISVLGTGIYFMTTTAAFSGIDANAQNRAYQLAIAGRDYALTRKLSDTAGSDFSYSNGDKFRLVINSDTIESTGIVNEGTPYEARETVATTKSGFSSEAGITNITDGASGPDSKVTVTQPSGAPSDFISTTSSAISLGKIGSAYQSQFGAIIYSGDAVQGDCVDGECKFGIGFNAFFVFQFAAGSSGDGFTFAFFNGEHNNASSVGGYSGIGELMGYAGNSYVSPGYYLDGQGGRGIQPPKIAVEFDPYQNGTSSACGSNSRYDANRNHMALLFWGDNTTFCGSTVGKNTFDDNRHGSGTDGSTDPMNAKSVIQSGWSKCHYFDGNNQCGSEDSLGWPSNWLLDAPDNVYAFRIEVTRSLEKNGSDNYDYQIKTWIKPCASGDLSCSAYNDLSNLANLKEEYTDSEPTLVRTFELDESYHDAFDTMLFGWTTATGGATQNVAINRFRMNFNK